MTSCIKNAKALATSKGRSDLLAIAEAGYQAIATPNVIQAHVALEKGILTIDGTHYPLDSFERVYLLAVGKCAYDAALALEVMLGEHIFGGVVIDVHAGKELKRVQAYTGTHPFPSAENVAYTKALLDLAEKATERDLVLAVVSGGGSTLLCQPKSHTPREETDLVQYLFRAGATIEELNSIRKHLSLARGGFLAEAVFPAKLVTLLFSDVPGDDPHTIASAPTLLDTSTREDALAVFRRYNGAKAGFAETHFLETPKDPAHFKKVKNHLILTNRTALSAMRARALELGYHVLIRETRLEGEAREVGALIAEELHIAREGSVLLYGGETTVTIQGKGKGGRNQELALGALPLLTEGEVLASCASDGRDNSDYAGGLVDKQTQDEAKKQNLDVHAFLAKNDSYTFFTRLHQGVETGYTGSNVADFIIALKEHTAQKKSMPKKTQNVLKEEKENTAVSKKSEFILWFKDLSIEDVPRVGGKNAALGEMVSELLPLGVRVPNGFAVTADAYRFFLQSTNLTVRIADALKGLDTHNMEDLQARGKKVRELILAEELPPELKIAIVTAYHDLVHLEGAEDVAVRSSATAEDLPGASFAGQQETFLNVVGAEDVIEATKKCIASLFTDRAISYRTDKGFANTEIALSVGVQKMVRSDLATSGVMFSVDTETGFDKVIVIEGSYGLGEMVVQGKVTPDSYIAFKPSLEKGLHGIIVRDIGPKEVKMVYEGKKGGVIIPVPEEDRNRLCLSDKEVETLARYALQIEKHFSTKHGRYQPMDMEWAKDGKTGELYIVQARPETVVSTRDKNVFVEHILTSSSDVLTKGTAVGTKIAVGKVRVIRDVKNIHEFQKGEVLVTEITDPDWEPIMKIASAIVTDKGGRTSHAAIVSRELGIPCIVGTSNATSVLHDGQEITVDCSSKEGRVLASTLSFEIKEHRLDNLPKLKTKVMVNIGSPDEAFKNTFLPVSGVGLGRLEFIIMSHIRVHPNALLEYEKLKWYAGEGQQDKQELVREIDVITRGFADKTRYYVEELTEGIAKIAAAFYPNPVIIRFSDFKTNEYRTLLGGYLYEPEEENPMIGWRGASRYYDEKFKTAFGLECEALHAVRTELGLDNVIPMVPFCRTLEEADKVLAVMKEHGLERGKEDLKVYMMCEIPANILLADEFLDRFDGFSIGSNDLTQLVLGMDRDNSVIAGIANENNEAVKRMIRPVIETCKKRKKYIGICGQAPSDFPEFAQFLVRLGIESLSFTPDTVIKTLPKIAEAEKE